MYHDGNFVYRQRETDNRHAKQVARARKRFHPRKVISPQFLVSCTFATTGYSYGMSPTTFSRATVACAVFFQKGKIGNIIIGRDQLIGKHASPRPRGFSLNRVSQA